MTLVVQNAADEVRISSHPTWVANPCCEGTLNRATPSGPAEVLRIETIDVSAADTSFFSTNHNSFADRQHLVGDMRLLLMSGQHPPHERFPLSKAEAPSATRE